MRYFILLLLVVAIVCAKKHDKNTNSKHNKNHKHKSSSSSSSSSSSEEHHSRPIQQTTARPAVATCSCGWTNRDEITGQNQYPWMVALYSLSRDRVTCSATIVSQFHAVTAAHCVNGRVDDYVLIIRAYDNGREVRQMIPLQNMVKHSGYNEEFRSNDIAVLVTRERIPFSGSVGRVCLPDRRIRLDGRPVRALGWERSYGLDDPLAVLGEVDLGVVSHNDCSQYWGTGYLTNSQNLFCTRTPRKVNCNENSGGPVVYFNSAIGRYTLVGVTSFGDYCMSPNVNTEVAAHVDWIENIIRATRPAEICKRATV